MGLQYMGLLNHHPNEVLGFAVNRVDVSGRYSPIHQAINQDAEYNIELNDSYFPMKWLMLRSNIQYVINTEATNDVDNALVLGLSPKIIF